MNYKEELLRHGLEIPYGTDKDILLKPLRLYGKKIHNRIGILPLEGFDSIGICIQEISSLCGRRSRTHLV